MYVIKDHKVGSKSNISGYDEHDLTGWRTGLITTEM